MSCILLTIDVEDWFQVENFKQCIPFSMWSSHELRVEKNTHLLLDLLDAVSSPDKQQPGSPLRYDKPPAESSASVPHQLRAVSYEHPSRPSTVESRPPSNGQRTADNGLSSNPKATFFILGWLAERLPHLVREIHGRGHEVASHGFHHGLCTRSSFPDLKQDLVRSRELLEDITGSPVVGYRAPSFSVNNDILKVIEESGYHYDSSYNSFGVHGRYGHLELASYERKGIASKISERFYELPVSNLLIGQRVLPWGGGGYFRLLPYWLFRRGVQVILKKDGAYLFYMHPWEIDPEQPRVENAPWSFRFRHYVNIDKTASRFSRFLSDFKEISFITCRDYLRRIASNC